MKGVIARSGVSGNSRASRKPRPCAGAFCFCRGTSQRSSAQDHRHRAASSRRMSCRIAVAPRAVRREEAQPPFAVEDKRARRVVHAVAARLERLLLVEDLELLRGARGRLRVAVEPEKRRMERRHVLRAAPPACRAPGSTVTNRTCTLSASGPSSRIDLRHLGERRRARIRAVREAEEHRHHLAAEIGQRARLPVVIGEVELLAEARPGDVGQLELGRLGRTRRSPRRAPRAGGAPRRARNEPAAREPGARQMGKRK